ncbi:MAG: hypothetical protein A3G82_05140 [Burkholderiales bacterium RIFCSPLOWO2_12_FULL_67_210]|nr:MAG: hypothetical protein A3G82_05140 [Burkholderiales bacterium RIFCSPLOWO2_12_FULL_67_210]
MALHQALGLADLKGPAAALAAADQATAWQPWRSYAVIRAWAGCHARPEAPGVTDGATHHATNGAEIPTEALTEPSTQDDTP